MRLEFGADLDEFAHYEKSHNGNSGSGLLAFQLRFLVNDSKYSDLTMIVGAEKFSVHRAILAARSDNFAAQIDQLNDNCRELVVDEKLASSKAMLPILHYLYSGILNLNSSNVLDIMNAANNLNIPQAVDICREYIANYGVPISSSDNNNNNENTERMRDVKESLSVAEMSIQNVENVLNVLNRKLETVTQRMSKFLLFFSHKFYLTNSH